jgi:hypothetical protein
MKVSSRAHRRSRSCYVVSVAVVILVPLIASDVAGAATGSLTYLKDGNVFVGPPMAAPRRRSLMTELRLTRIRRRRNRRQESSSRFVTALLTG